MKNRTIPSIIAASCTLVFSTAVSSANEAGDAQGWRNIESGTYSAIEEETRLVINDAKAWDEWWKKHTKTIHDTTQPDGIKAPEVDFKKETVILATLGVRTTGGHQILFSGIKRDGDALTAIFQTISPGPDDMVTMALTYPFAIIAVPKHEGEVKFVVK